LETLPRPEGIEIHAEGLGALPDIDADAGRLRQVFLNLLENAIHAAGTKGEVWVRGEEAADHVVLSVEDSGPGIDAATRARLFEPLVTTKAKGIGLGLALVRRIVARHGGDVAYAPREGHGARFVVRLPIGAAHA
jgi:signal transduction histidine kinase